jgi:hypothetical protein
VYMPRNGAADVRRAAARARATAQFDDVYDITGFDTYVNNNCPNYFSATDNTAVVCPRDSESSTITLADGNERPAR